MEPTISVIIPARNEALLIGCVLEAVLRAATMGDSPRHLSETTTEVIVVDNASTDHTAQMVQPYATQFGVRLAHCARLKAPCARNHGAHIARGRIFVFVDADTLMPPHSLNRIQHLCHTQGYEAGIARLGSLEGGLRAWGWWTFWGLMRALPIARAKAMPALMFCTRATFHEFGPFDERVVIVEEWPILAGLYQARPQRFIYDRAITARSSNRRMALQPFGYVRTFFRYVWAVAHFSGRLDYSDQWRGRWSPRELVT